MHDSVKALSLILLTIIYLSYLYLVRLDGFLLLAIAVFFSSLATGNIDLIKQFFSNDRTNNTGVVNPKASHSVNSRQSIDAIQAIQKLLSEFEECEDIKGTSAK
jgi:multisubunit Na+/H+ antiporter MnhE subunit